MRRADSGFTLVELVIALSLVAMTVLAVAPLFVFASRENASVAEQSSAGALAVRRMELLRATPYADLDDGGDLASNVAGYFDDSQPHCSVRWTIAARTTAPMPGKVITVRATARGPLAGTSREAEIVTVRVE
jgi:prepilin-type N-terminal cleavage/methylation domain-containing protein